jgi:hypothetical protein
MTSLQRSSASGSSSSRAHTLADMRDDSEDDMLEYVLARGLVRYTGRGVLSGLFPPGEQKEGFPAACILM